MLKDMSKEVVYLNIEKLTRPKTLTDAIQMAKIDGYDVTQKIKKIDRDRRNKIRAERRKKRMKAFRHTMYRVFHFGKKHPDEIYSELNSPAAISKLYSDLINNPGETYNLDRKMFLTENGSWLVGPKISEMRECEDGIGFKKVERNA